jgi:uncharacterized membrane protein
MPIFKLLFKRETMVPMAALSLATAVSGVVIIARVLVTRNLCYSFLIWNLFLAWLPLVLALLAREQYRQSQAATSKAVGWHFLGLSAAWLLFFPNAPYIFTDLVHLTTRYFPQFWIDLAVILQCAFIGLMLGFVSLYLMHSLVTQRYGQIVGWLFVAGVTGLSSFGIYLGRFLRFNSWDVVANPGKLYEGLSSVATGQAPQQGHFTFLALFATFLFVAYVMLYALTHLPKAHPMAEPASAENLLPA